MRKNKILIHIDKKEWKNYTKIIKEMANFVLLDKHQVTTLSILLTDSDYMQKLNATYRKKDKDTNVLAFPIDEEILGEVILSYGKIIDELEEWKRDFTTHVLYLVIHGILHLLGYDHEKEEDAILMEEEEDRIMKNFLKTYNTTK